jgi:RHS repeat-associated protein
LRGFDGTVLRMYWHPWSRLLWSFTRDYIYRNGQLLAAVEADGTIHHFHLDHLGTPRLITDQAGNRVALHSYYPFGQEATDPEQSPFSLKFTGHERDENGDVPKGVLDYMKARYCSPILGRFLSLDPVLGDPRKPQSWNRYAYVQGNPINFTDPDGQRTASDVAQSVQNYVQDLEEFTNANTSGDPLGILLNFLVGSTGDTVVLAVEPLRAGEAIGTAVGSGNSAGGVVLAVGQDALRMASLAGGLGGAAAVTRTAVGKLGLVSGEVNVAYRTALAGGKHAGSLRNYAGRSPAEIQKAIGGYERQVALHQQKIANPAKFAERWGQMNARERAGLLKKWQSDLARNQELANVLRGLTE